MNAPSRTIALTTIDIGVRVAGLVVVSEAVERLYAGSHPEDDGLGTGLTVMAVLFTVAAVWGAVDGFFRAPPRLCLTWVLVGGVFAVVLTLTTNVESGSVDWSVAAADLSSAVWIWGIVLVAAPAICCGIVQSAVRHPDKAPVRSAAPPR